MATPEAQPLPRHRGRVKQVLSGDTVVIQGQPRNGPPPERTLSFAGITAPRLARRPNQREENPQPDEPFAWEAREFLRRKLVGQEVQFTVEYTVPSGREFGTVFIGHGPMEENVTRSLLASGLAKIREGSRGEGEAFQELVQVAAQAQAAGAGAWAAAEGSDKGVRKIKWAVEDPVAFVQKVKGKPLDAIIEQVRDGSTVRAFLLPSFQYVTVMFSGIKTPSFKRDPSGTDKPEPFAEEAKYYTEVRLLQREVKIILEGVSNQSALLGTVIHPKGGNISEHLVRDGYARCVDFSMGLVTQSREALRAGEREAKEKRLRIWKTYTPSAGVPIADKKFQGVVREIVHVDTLVVEGPGGVKKIFLSSIRRPKAAGPSDDDSSSDGGRRRGGNRLLDLPFGLEAREFLRKKLIGQTVDVEVDYIKPANEGFPEKICATVRAGGINISEALVSKGYCTVVRHRGDDENRASGYDELLVAESRAQQNKKGVHGNTDKAKAVLVEVQKKDIADRYLSALQRGRTSGVVEFVTSGSRFRVYIPSQNCVCTVLLAGINCPRTGRGDQPDQPFAADALALSRRLCMQHDVDLEIEDVDRNGGFVGHVFVDSTNVGLALLQNGFAQTHHSVERYKHASQYSAAEAEAKGALKGLWATYKEPEVKAEAVPIEDKKDRTTKYVPVMVADVLGPISLAVQAADAGPTIEKLMGELSSAFASKPPVAGAASFKKGDLIAAQFSADNCWYRARVLSRTGSEVEVLYVDYGNSETIPLSRTAQLPASLLSLAPQAREVKLAFLAPPPPDYQDEAIDFLRQSLTNQQVLLNVEYTDGGVENVTIIDPETKNDYAKELLQSGYAHVQRRREQQFRNIMAEYGQAVESAKEGHFGMWMYGDATPDDAREFGSK